MPAAVILLVVRGIFVLSSIADGEATISQTRHFLDK
jgi:hypothetical protein